MIDEKIKEYFELKNQIDELTKKKDELASSLKEELQAYPEGKLTEDGRYKAKIVSRTTYKYTDETAIINYLTQRGLSEIYITKKIDTTKFNKELKNKGVLYEALKNSIVENTSDSLTVDDMKAGA